ncbi:MAG: DHH family phosphoesterase [Patescibacteria group bacterium]|nr:DHH family phosphoesterase [Patescibacteria group bacterium]
MQKIKNLTKAAERIKKAVADKERIILYGDSDLDGVSSVLVAEQAIRSIGGSIETFYFPDREKEGYGITKLALETFKGLPPALLIAFDLGIGNVEEIQIAKEMGFDVIIVDHHIVPDVLPEADIIVDPKQPGDNYPFKEFAAVGLSYKLAHEILGKDISDSLKNSIVELALLGTISDMMPREEDNITIIQEGMDAIGESWRPGLQAFFEMSEFARIDGREARVEEIITVLNAREVTNGLPGAFRVLTAPTKEKAEEIINLLLEQMREKKEEVWDIVLLMRERVEGKASDSVILEGTDSHDFYRLGSAASILTKEYHKPVYLYKIAEKESLGSARAEKGFNTVEAMKSCANLLETYGGHPPASGFRIKNENIEKFKKCLEDYAKQN